MHAETPHMPACMLLAPIHAAGTCARMLERIHACRHAPHTGTDTSTDTNTGTRRPVRAAARGKRARCKHSGDTVRAINAGGGAVYRRCAWVAVGGSGGGRAVQEGLDLLRLLVLVPLPSAALLAGFECVLAAD